MKYYTYCLLLMIVTASCTDEWLAEDGGVIRGGVPVTVALDLGVSSSKIVSRAAEKPETERTVNSVYIFAFNSDGSLDNKQLFTPRSSTNNCITNIEFSMHSGSDKRIYAIANPTSGSGTLSANYLATEIDTEDELLACTSSLLIPTNIERSYFLMSGKMESSVDGGTINVTESGEIQGADMCSHGTSVIELERVDARITFKIYASNPNFKDFTFIPDRYWVDNIPQHTYVFPHDEDYTKADGVNYVSMSDPKVDVQHNVEGQESDANGKYYYFEFYIPENRLQPKKRIDEGDDEEKQAENLYALREKKLKTPATDSNKPGKTEENGAFEYANDHSTYVVFHGVLSYTDTSNGQQFVYSDATYTVHLGSTGGANDSGHENNVDFVNDYNTYRNTHYTYTIHVTGVESMRVEVEADQKEDRPGIEGDLIFSGDAVEEMDAHYGRTQFTLTQSDIKDGLSWAIRTPFQSGMKPFNADNYKYKKDEEEGRVLTDINDYSADEWKKLQTDLDLNDYKWVQFLINDEVEMKDDQLFPKYPGYAAYVGDEYVDDVIKEPAPPFGGIGTENSAYYQGQKVKLYDVNQLLNHLYADAYNGSGVFADGNESVTITAFVDEYVYVYDPSKIYYRTPQVVSTSSTSEGIDLMLWQDVVNRDNRMLYLCTTGAQYSPDGETSVSRNVFTIAQKPIYTFFNENDPDVTTAWGTESINETGPISPWPNKECTEEMPNTDYRAEFGGGSNKNEYNSVAKGLPNTLNVLYNGTQKRDLKWTDIMTLENRENGEFFQLNKDYNNIWYACIARNRDLDGDNEIDDNEIRWYLASIDQLTDLWVGQYSLNESTWLYDGDGTKTAHVASSSYYDAGSGYNKENKNASNPYVIWAEEGASRGALSGSIGYNGQSVNAGENTKNPNMNYHYRCVRNLGISLDNPEGDFTSYAEIVEKDHVYENSEGETFNEVILSLERMETNSIRSAIYRDAELPEHHEREYTNRPYKSFAVIKDKRYNTNGKAEDGNIGSWVDYRNAIRNGIDICPKGYRLPNQREMMLMYMNIPDDDITDGIMSWLGGSDHYVTRTAFGYDEKYNQDRPGFMYATDTGNLFLETSSNHKGYVRCVRDVPE